MDKPISKELPVAIIGAGPIGLAAAAHLAVKGQKFIILEAGTEIADNIRKWEHVRLFSPWPYNMDKAAKELLVRHNWKEPNQVDLPTGKEVIAQYLEPLARLPEIEPSLFLNTVVVSISRKNIDKMKTINRGNQPFILFVEKENLTERIEAKAVIDASGTWSRPNPVNSEGIWTSEEKALNEHIYYGIPNLLGEKNSRYKGKRIAVVGGGHSALNTLIELAKLKESDPQTELIWIMRKRNVEEAYGGEGNDQLEARGELGTRIHQLVHSGIVHVITPFHVQQVKSLGDSLLLTGENEGEIRELKMDEIIVNTGSRPDFSFLSELRLSIDQTTESVVGIAPLIDPNVHSCGTVRPHGEKELRHNEEGFYIVGMKSYGRAPTFLMATGYEQVRSIAAYLSGDIESATKVELVLPETGVCSTNNLRDPENKGSSCCTQVVHETPIVSSCGTSSASNEAASIPVSVSSSCCK
ncbi:NAD(P)-binding domain-containing protein [Bacillus sp. V59.32b]|uniref:NAD(P)-binding domain-containing protein n=1 Tax=Bacillus sp. V59.32b TaxID=1758642 RepID=UPI000E3C2D97|nr:NAD(P)-binding domain-containing protein [Bacillus sp. V59.32b]RFU60152.1 NAD(P)/FAD-dependent oxidoreductase [Bacillus sp. V59.32b]